MKSFQIRSYFWSVFSRIRTEYEDLRRVTQCNSLHCNGNNLTVAFRSSRRNVICKKVFLEISQNCQENTRARVCFNKVAGLRPATLFLKKTLTLVFSCEFCKIQGFSCEFLKTPFLQKTLIRLLLLFFLGIMNCQTVKRIKRCFCKLLTFYDIKSGFIKSTSDLLTLTMERPQYILFPK